MSDKVMGAHIVLPKNLVDRGRSRADRDPVAHFGQVQRGVKLLVEVIVRDEVLERNGNGSVEGSAFGDRAWSATLER